MIRPDVNFHQRFRGRVHALQLTVPGWFSWPHRRQSHGVVLGAAAETGAAGGGGDASSADGESGGGGGRGASAASSLEPLDERDSADVGRDTGRLELVGSAVAVCGGLDAAGTEAMAASTTPPANTAHAHIHGSALSAGMRMSITRSTDSQQSRTES